MELRLIARPLVPLPGLVLIGVALNAGVPAPVLAIVFVIAFALTFWLVRWARTPRER